MKGKFDATIAIALDIFPLSVENQKESLERAMGAEAMTILSQYVQSEKTYQLTMETSM